MVNFTPALRLYGALRDAHLSKREYDVQQERTLRALVSRASATRFGKDHSFSSIHSVADYQRNVPLRTYEDFWKTYWQPNFPHLKDCTSPGQVQFFAVSSGTTSGSTKYIPCPRALVESNKKAGLDLLVHHLRNRPRSAIFGGKSFILGGSTELVEEAPNVFSGDLSGIAVMTLPWWARLRYFPPAEIALIKNWEEKIETLARLCLKEDIRMISGVPSWLLIFFETLQTLSGRKDGTLAQFFPRLEMLVHGGVNFTPYRERFERLLEGSRAELREVYPASEGFIAIADRGGGDGLRLNLDTGIFYEFVPVEDLSRSRPERRWIKTVSLNENYAIVLSTCGGAWSYLLGDTVRFVSLDPPRVLITGRTSYMLSAFGEHLTGEEIEDAVTHAAGILGLTINDFSVGALYPEREGELGGHLYLIECDEGSSDHLRERFATLLDTYLSKRNEDYCAHRAEGFGLRLPICQMVVPGTFAQWMKARGKLGGQNKVPRIINDQTLFRSLREFVAAYRP